MITKNPFALLLLDIHTTFLQNFKKIGDIEFFHLVRLAYSASYSNLQFIAEQNLDTLIYKVICGLGGSVVTCR